MYSANQLRILARAYCEGTDTTPPTLGRHILDNEKFIVGLFAGRDCLTRQAERASDWLCLNWPPWLPWPAEVRREAGYRRREGRLRHDGEVRERRVVGERSER